MLRELWLPLGWLWVGIVCYLSLMPHPPEPITFTGVDKLEHALAYALLMGWFAQICKGVWARLGVMLALVAMGVGIEFLQGMMGYRYFEYADMLANTSGVVVGAWLAGTRLGLILEKLEQYGKE